MSKIKTKENKENISSEAKQNLLGFFDLLLEIDMRNNPELYKKNINKKEIQNYGKN